MLFRSLLEKIIKKIPEIKKSRIVLQAAGTFLSQSLETTMVVSIGGGTTEILLYHKKERIFTDSMPVAFDFVSSKLDDELGYLDMQSLEKHSAELKDRSHLLAAKLANSIIQIQNKKKGNFPIIFSGGGILFAPLAKSLKEKLSKYEIIIPQEPEFQNAIDMFENAC